MARPDSPYWDWKLGVCEKHYLPIIPCPQCLATEDKDVEFRLDKLDGFYLADGEVTLQDLVPTNCPWLAARVC